MATETPILVFAKAPVPGTVKTRLIPLLGADGAATLHRRLVHRTLAAAAAAAVGPIELWCAAEGDATFLHDCARTFQADLRDQSGGDLGQRMLHAFRCALQGAQHAVLIGTDCPVLEADLIRDAVRALEAGSPAVFCPAEDGGYALIGLAQCDPKLFEGICWGEGNVMADTRARLRELGWRWRELSTVWDVDRPEDYQRLQTARLLGESDPHDLSTLRHNVSPVKR